jgi:hypothetical protein
MADAAFALSPISAQPASPTDADFQAISEAFMETTRGRWFLAEFARRNRNADTAMVLDAVARIERSLAAQKEQQAQPEPPPPPEPSSELPEALAAVKTILAAARGTADAVLSDPSADLGLGPARKCARVIREIAWGLRESGADGRICTLLESQVEAINAACDQVSVAGLREGVLQAFDHAAQQIAALTDGPPSESNEMATPTADEAIAPAPQVIETPTDVSDDDLFETAAPENVEAEIAPEIEPAAVVPDRTDAAAVEMLVTPDAAETAAIMETAAGPVATAVPEPAPETPQPASLGATLIANGIVAKPAGPRIDLLAPLRRMSLAERVAFFS